MDNLLSPPRPRPRITGRGRGSPRGGSSSPHPSTYSAHYIKLFVIVCGVCQSNSQNQLGTSYFLRYLDRLSILGGIDVNWSMFSQLIRFQAVDFKRGKPKRACAFVLFSQICILRK